MIEMLIASFLTIHTPAYADYEMTQGQWDEFNRMESYCLAENVYHEARNQPLAGQMAVISVTINRVNDDRFPNTICGVVKQGPHRPSWKGTGEMIPIRHKCQFSWYCDGVKDIIWANKEKTGQTIEANARAWQDSVNVAIWTTGWGDIKITDNTKGAVFYYAHNLVYPTWADQKEYIGVLGNHTFMK